MPQIERVKCAAGSPDVARARGISHICRPGVEIVLSVEAVPPAPPDWPTGSGCSHGAAVNLPS